MVDPFFHVKQVHLLRVGCTAELDFYAGAWLSDFVMSPCTRVLSSISSTDRSNGTSFTIPTVMMTFFGTKALIWLMRAMFGLVIILFASVRLVSVILILFF